MTMRAKRPLREPVREAPGPKLKNYITPAGLQRLKDEHRFLLNRERPAVTQVVTWAASNGDRSENADYQYGKRRLRQIDSRIRFLAKRIDAAEVVDPAAPRSGSAATRVFFGATVTYKDAAGREHVVQHRRHRRSRPEPPLHQLDVAAGARADEVDAGRPRHRARAEEDRTDRGRRRRVRRDSDGPVPRTARAPKRREAGAEDEGSRTDRGSGIGDRGSGIGDRDQGSVSGSFERLFLSDP